VISIGNSTAPLLEMRSIKKDFFGNQVLTDINFTLGEGEVLGLCGENGAVYVFGPQKGVREEEKPDFDKKMKHFADKTQEFTGRDYRTAEGAGVSGIILSKDCVDIYNPKTIRSTMGAIYRMPFIYVEDLPEACALLKKKEICLYAAHLDGAHFYDEEDYSGGCAFLIGNEGNGLRDEVAACADVRIKIPMHGQVESLNAAVAASILMYEVCRQRRKE